MAVNNQQIVKPQEPTTQEDLILEVEEESTPEKDFEVIDVEINGIEEHIVMDENTCPLIEVDEVVQLTSDNKQLPKELFFGANAPCDDTNHGIGQYYLYMSKVYAWRHNEHVNRHSPEKRLERKLDRQKKAQQKTELELKELQK